MTNHLVENLGLVWENDLGSVDGRPSPHTNFQKFKSTVTTGSVQDLAKEERTGKILYDKVVIKEQQAKYLRSLIKNKVGTNCIEANQIISRNEMRIDCGRRVKDIVSELKIKMDDAERAAVCARKERDVSRGIRRYLNMIS